MNDLRHNDFADTALNRPLSAGIILERGSDGEVRTNVPHLVMHHSPDGFEFGYPGSGPADLALNILEAVLSLQGYVGERVELWDGDCWRLAWRLHQRLKWHFLAGLPSAGAVIPLATVVSWIGEQVTDE